MADEARDAQDAGRRANHRFREAALPHSWGGGLLPFLCECADVDCVDRIEMTGADYDATHLDPDVYVVLWDHAIVDGEQVVEDRDAFLVMTKAAAG